ncbi:MAG TPA: hypothetical protein VF035_10240 [Longimicrobiales bacterium]
MGQEMAPWDSRREVKDTTANGQPAVAIAQYSRTDGAGVPRYVSTAILTKDMHVLRSSWVGNGAEPGACRVDVAGQNGSLVIGDGSAASVDMGERPMPDFALPVALASSSLRDGETIRFRIYHCSWSDNSPSAIMFLDFAGTVSSGSMQRAGSTSPEPVWVVTGTPAFPYKAWIAKSDRVVLKTVVPQGADGEMIETFSGSR